MNDEKDLINLVKIVSSKTNQNPELVKLFITQLFKEIEKELITTSSVKVDGLGIFRIINSIPANKILFLGKFQSESKPARPSATVVTDIPIKTSETKLTVPDLRQPEKPEVKKEVAKVDEVPEIEEVQKEELQSESSKQQAIEAEMEVTIPEETGVTEISDNTEDSEPEVIEANLTKVDEVLEIEEIQESPQSESIEQQNIDVEVGVTIPEDSEVAAEEDTETTEYAEVSEDSEIAESAEITSEAAVHYSPNYSTTETEAFEKDEDFGSVNEILHEEYGGMLEEAPRRGSNFGVIILFIAIIIAVIGLLILLYPKETNDLYAPIERVQAYTILENTDTALYLSKVITDYELDFPSLSLDFYGSELFWPYIYKANESEVNNLFEIKAGTIIYIPKLAPRLIDKNNKQSVDSIKILQQEIITLRVSQQEKRMSR